MVTLMMEDKIEVVDDPFLKNRIRKNPSRVAVDKYECSHGYRFYFFMIRSRWICHIRKFNTKLGVWDLVDIITDVNDNSDGIVSARIEKY